MFQSIYIMVFNHSYLKNINKKKRTNFEIFGIIKVTSRNFKPQIFGRIKVNIENFVGEISSRQFILPQIVP